MHNEQTLQAADSNNYVHYVQTETTCVLKQQHQKTSLSGELVLLSDNLVLFLGNPMVKSLKELAERSLKISDIPRSDSTRELILLKHQRSTEFDLM